MGLELDIGKQLASINVTLSELISITNTVNTELQNTPFGIQFNEMIEQIAQSFDVVTDNLLPLCEMASEEEFSSSYDNRHSTYKDTYLMEISKPRNYGEQAYEQYLELKTSREMKTGYPLLKRSFERFDFLIDKWINNDAWLAMSIDNLFKRLQQLLNEIGTLNTKDPADAFTIYQSAFAGFKLYIDLLKQQHSSINPVPPLSLMK